MPEAGQHASYRTDTAEITGFESFGVKMYLAGNRPEINERLPSLLPPGASPCAVADVEHKLTILGNDSGTYEVNVDGNAIARTIPLDLALEMVGGLVHSRVALNARERVFIHAGVAAHNGRAVVIPGASFAGKTALVAALVRAGATYYSDEFAPLDADGLVYPYAKPLSLRDADRLQRSHSVESLGGIAGSGPVPVGLIVKTSHRAGARWAPQVVGAGAGALALMAQAISAQARPADATRAIARAVEGALVLEGERGEADEVAPRLLAELEARVA